MSNSSQNQIPYVPQDTLDPAAGLNDAIRVIDALLNTRVINMTTNAPPGSPADGAAYIVGSSPTGAWAGHAKALAVYVQEGAFWNFYAAGQQAWLILNKADGNLYKWNAGSSAWELAAGIGEAPLDGQTYARKNGTWEAVAGLTNVVTSVNGVGPDSSGNVDVAGGGDVATVNGQVPDSDGEVLVNALAVPYDHSASHLVASTVQAAIDELAARSGGGGASVGTYASRPAASNGAIYQCTDAPLKLIGSGGVWTPWNQDEAIVLPPTSISNWVNQGTAVASNIGPFINVRAQAAAGTSLKILYKTLASATPYTVTALIKFNCVDETYNQGGLVLFNTSGAPYIVFGITGRGPRTAATQPPRTLDISRLTNTTTFGSSVFSNGHYGGNRIWFRIQDNGTNRIFSYSIDGLRWIQILSESRTTYLTANAIGIYSDTENANTPMDTLLLSFSETNP
jgi:hypothetical protein